jgi:ATP-dependent RNA circularization protein (DNA/RNA ligase family)
MGHRAIASLLDGPVLVEEKIDGSQVSFGVTEDGEIKVRSKGAVIHPDAPEKMFTEAVATVKDLAPNLKPGWTYRGEYLKKPKHNSLAYNRTPIAHIMLFDINDGYESYLSYEQKQAEAIRLGLEVVPLLFSGKVESVEQFRSFIDRKSVLGGQKIEGVVVKPVNYDLFGADKKVLMGKFVSEAFREVHRMERKKSNHSSGDILDILWYGVQVDSQVE